MSGSKRVTVTIREEEYQRLLDAEQKLRKMPKPKTEQQLAMEQRSFEKIQATMFEAQQRQATFQELLLGMNGTIQKIEENTSRAMQEFQDNTTAELEQYAGELSRYVDKRLADQTRRFEKAIAANHRTYQEEIAQLRREIRQQAADQQQKRALAEEWLQAGEALAQFLRATYACDFYAPGQLDRLEQTLLQARQNLDHNLIEAAISPAQQVYLSLSELRVQLEQWEQEWQLVYQAVDEALEELRVQAEDSRRVGALDLDGSPLPYEVDVEQWSDGRWQAVVDQIEMLSAQLRAPTSIPDTQTLNLWLSEDLPGLSQELSAVVVDARVAALNSQLRINIADLVVQALQEQGFVARTSQYENDDLRNCFHVQLDSIDGGEVLVQVEPFGAGIGENRLQIDSIDREERTEHELHQRWTEITRSLAGYGIQLENYERLDERSRVPAAAAVQQRQVQNTRSQRAR